ncbi:hypothetical protein EC988_008498, partial [Linderina pennispora]
MDIAAMPVDSAEKSNATQETPEPQHPTSNGSAAAAAEAAAAESKADENSMPPAPTALPASPNSAVPITGNAAAQENKYSLAVKSEDTAEPPATATAAAIATAASTSVDDSGLGTKTAATVAELGGIDTSIARNFNAVPVDNSSE